MLISNLSEPVVIGAATMQKRWLKLNFETDEAIIDPRVSKLRLLEAKLMRGLRYIGNTYGILSKDIKLPEELPR